MNKKKHYKLVIIGSGPAGLTAGIYASRARLNPLIIEGQKPGGQLTGTTYVENWPGEKMILGPELMTNMQEHAKNAGCEFLAENVVKTDLSGRPFKIWTHRETEITADAIIIATGAIPRKLNCPGADTYWGKGITTCAVCDAAFYPDKRVVIVGGGDTAMEFVTSLSKFTDKITVIQLLDKLTASPAMQERAFKDNDVNVIYNSTITRIDGDETHITKISVKNEKTGKTEEMPVDGIFLAIGLTPNTEFVKGQLDLDSYGYIQTIDHSTRTSVKGIFAAGDVMDPRYRQAIVSAGAGCMAALDAERFLESVD